MIKLDEGVHISECTLTSQRYSSSIEAGNILLSLHLESFLP